MSSEGAMKPQVNEVLVVALAVCAAMIALPVGAQFCPNGGEIPTCPAWADINGNRHYDSAIDALITFDFSANPYLDIDSPWEATCGEHPQVRFNSVLDSMYDQVQFGRWTLTIDGFDAEDHPNAFALNSATGGPVGRGTLVDENRDGCYDRLDLRRSDDSLYLLLGFEFLCTNGDGLAEYISADWAQASMFGMDGSCGMNGGDPQIWFPMLNSQIVPTSQNMYRSGCLRSAEGIPTLSQWGLLLSLAALAVAGWWLLRRRRVIA